MLFATATERVTRLTDAHRAGRLPQERTRLPRYGLIIVDEVGYLPFEQDTANQLFQLVSSRYEHASLILTPNLLFSGWGGVLGEQAVAAAMVDRADFLTMKGANYRLRNCGIDFLPRIRTQDTTKSKDGRWASIVTRLCWWRNIGRVVKSVLPIRKDASSSIGHGIG